MNDIGSHQAGDRAGVLSGNGGNCGMSETSLNRLAPPPQAFCTATGIAA